MGNVLAVLWRKPKKKKKSKSTRVIIKKNGLFDCQLFEDLTENWFVFCQRLSLADCFVSWQVTAQTVNRSEGPHFVFAAVVFTTVLPQFSLSAYMTIIALIFALNLEWHRQWQKTRAAEQTLTALSTRACECLLHDFWWFYVASRR